MLEGNPSSVEDGYSINWPYPCDACHDSACELYCCTDSTYLCRRCNLHLHTGLPMAFHERGWVDNASASFTCQAYSNEIQIPSTNLLVPMTPPSGFLFASSTTNLEADHGPFPGTEHENTPSKSNEKLQAEADSWLLLDLDNDSQNANSGTAQHGKEVDENLYFLKYNSLGQYDQYQYHLDQTDQMEFAMSHDLTYCSRDRVDPVQPLIAAEEQQQQLISFDREHEPSKDTLMYATPTSQRVPLSFIDPGYLFCATTSDTLNSYSSFLQGTSDSFPNPSLSIPLPFNAMDREASVLRYREKRRLRKYHKKIRYASRKVNAENRQRVKGRFASKQNRGFEVDKMFSSEDGEHGTIPSYQAQ